MWSPSTLLGPAASLHLLLYFLHIFSIPCSASRSHENSSISAIFVFGDSTVDSGNNNYIKTISRSNFPPYGKDFPSHVPTGRFTNGRLVTDFIVSYAGIKDTLPPYLDPTLGIHDLRTGVCFASAGTGFDPLTALISNGVVTLQQQLQYFKEYKSRIEAYVGREETARLIRKGVFLVSAGTNDFIVNYYGPPIRRKSYSISSYQQFILEMVQQFIEGLMEMGAQKIAVVGLPPIGCVPAVITLNSDHPLDHRGCIDRLSSVARDYNRLLQKRLTAIRSHGAMLKYVDVYKPIDDIVSTPQQFGFEKVSFGCCGSGLIEISILCNSLSPVCSDASKYVFWDSVHPTEAAYYKIFQSVIPVVNQFLHPYN